MCVGYVKRALEISWLKNASLLENPNRNCLSKIPVAFLVVLARLWSHCRLPFMTLFWVTADFGTLKKERSVTDLRLDMWLLPAPHPKSMSQDFPEHEKPNIKSENWCFVLQILCMFSWCVAVELNVVGTGQWASAEQMPASPCCLSVKPGSAFAVLSSSLNRSARAVNYNWDRNKGSWAHCLKGWRSEQYSICCLWLSSDSGLGAKHHAKLHTHVD